MSTRRHSPSCHLEAEDAVTPFVRASALRFHNNDSNDNNNKNNDDNNNDDTTDNNDEANAIIQAVVCVPS